MEKRHFASIGEDISLLGYGCMRFPTRKSDGMIAVRESRRLLERAKTFAKENILCLEPMHRRMWREVFVQPYRELMAKTVRASLAQEAYAAELCVVKPGENHALQFREEFMKKMEH